MKKRKKASPPATKKDLSRLGQQMDARMNSFERTIKQMNTTMNDQFKAVFEHMERGFDEMREYVDQKFEEEHRGMMVLFEHQRKDLVDVINEKHSQLDDRVTRLEHHPRLVAA